MCFLRLCLTFVLPVLFAPWAAAQKAVQESGPGVARISLVEGEAVVQRDGTELPAEVNFPLLAGSRIRTGPESRAEVQFDPAHRIRLGADSEIAVSELTEASIAVRVERGRAVFSSLRESPASVSVSAPGVTIRPGSAAVLRISVHHDGTSDISLRAGRATVETTARTVALESGQAVSVLGSPTAPVVATGPALAEDDFDRWSQSRDRQALASRSYEYVPGTIEGAEDLDSHGQWLNDRTWGWVWSPNVGAGWSPYLNGSWTNFGPFGWTWISADPWGWAPHHYGRWFHKQPFGWLWFPGSRGVRQPWSPAVVGFPQTLGPGYRFSQGFGPAHTGWVPLAPFEPLRPWWGSSAGGVVVRPPSAFRNFSHWRDSHPRAMPFRQPAVRGWLPAHPGLESADQWRRFGGARQGWRSETPDGWVRFGAGARQGSPRSEQWRGFGSGQAQGGWSFSPGGRGWSSPHQGDSGMRGGSAPEFGGRGMRGGGAMRGGSGRR